MSIHTPSKYTTFGALDSVAFEDGSGFSAHLLRAIGANSNRLACRAEHLMSFVWPIRSAGETDPDPMLVHLASDWIQISPPFTVPKKLGITRAEFRAIAAVPGTDTAYIQIATLARPFDPAADTQTPGDSILKMTGDGDNDWDAYADNGNGVELVPGESEEISLFAKGDGAQALMNTGTYGTPNTGTSNGLGWDEFSASGASWNVAIQNGDVRVHFVDAGGVLVAQPRIIAHRFDTNTLKFSPNLTPEELAAIVSAGLHFELRVTPYFGLGALSLAAKERTP